MFKPFKSRLIASTLLGAALLASSGARAVPVSAWELATVSGNWSDSWSFGDLFTVGSSNITVSSLGALDVGLDGFKSNGILVGLYRESDQALLASTPGLAGSGVARKRIVLSGELPSPLNPPQGCVFSTRCPYAVAQCHVERPPLRELMGRKVACFEAEKLTDK